MASKLITLYPHEAQNQLELSLREAYVVNQPKLTPPLKFIIFSPEDYLNINRAIVYGVLCEPTLGKVHIKYLHAIVNDGYCFFIKLLVQIVDGLYSKLLDSPKIRLIWVVSVMIDVAGVGFDSLVVSLLRQIVGGDFSDWNMWLRYEVANLLVSKWDLILDEEPVVLGYGLYTYLRLLADCYGLGEDSRAKDLKRKEIGFCVRVLREQFHLCLKIGRDLIRLLQDLVHIPEFRAIWKDLLLKPSTFGIPGFSDISRIYGMRTSSRYFLLRITPEMETQLRFLLTHVKLGSQRRHQAWFARKFLFGPERETIISDIVRFICCGHHPSNEVLQSEVIPRWAVIGWLLKSCTKKYIEARVKLTLFYDWLFFDEKVDNVMNVEPAMLLMVNSLPRYVDMTHSLIEFLLLLVENYDMDRKDVILKGVSSSISVLVSKGVIASLDVLTSCNFLSPFVKKMLQKFMLQVESGVVPEHQLPEMPSCEFPSPTPHTSSMELLQHPPEVVPAHPVSTELTTQQSSVVFPEPRLSDLPSFNLPSPTPHTSSMVPRLPDLPSFNLPSPTPHTSSMEPRLPDLPSFNLSSPTPHTSSMEIEHLLDVVLAHPVNTEMITHQSSVPDFIDSGASLNAKNVEQVNEVMNLISKIGDSMKISSKLGQEIVEEILLLCSCDNPDKLGDVSSEVLACEIKKELCLAGYDLFSPLANKLFSPVVSLRNSEDAEDEVQCVTTTIIRAFIFTQHQRIKEMLYWWSNNGCLVGARLLSYALRLSHAAHDGGYGASCNDEVDTLPPLMKFHIEGSFSYISRNGKDVDGAISPKVIVDKQVISKMIDDAYAAYRSIMFANSSIAVSQKLAVAPGKLISTHILSCSLWKDQKFQAVFHGIFSYLSDLSLGDKDLVSLPVSQLEDSDIVSIQIDLGLKRYAIFGKDVQKVFQVIRRSVYWKQSDQYKFWALATSELTVSGVPLETLLLCCFFSEDLDPKACAILFGGLMTLCNSHPPTPEIVGAAMLLPDDKFPDFAAAVLSHWAHTNQTMLSNSFADFLHKFKSSTGDVPLDLDGIVINQSAVLFLLNYLEVQGELCNKMLDKLGLNLSDIRTRFGNPAVAMDTG